MPLLSFVTDLSIDPGAKRTFADRVASLYAEHMDTTTDHVAIEIREVGSGGLWLGRATDPEAGHLFLDADVREGRSADQRRAFALAVIDRACMDFSLPDANLKVVFTEHAGPEMMGANRIGSEWTAEETAENG